MRFYRQEYVNGHGITRPWVILALLLLQACSGADDDAITESTSNTLTETPCIKDFNQRQLGNQLGLINPWEGGLLYDIWWAQNQAPVTEHPLWSQRAATNTLGGENSWRCVQCHGWDYNGKDGAMGNTSSADYTGFPGITAAQTKPAAAVFCAIADGSNINPNHVFMKDAGNSNSEGLDETSILKLTAFIKAGNDNGIINVTNCISTSGVSKGNADNGQLLFDSTCATCHGSEGTIGYPAGETLGYLADNEPFEIMHKIRFGQPYAEMPAFTQDNAGIELSSSQIADIIAYAQLRLPNPSEPAKEICSVANAQFVTDSYASANAITGGKLYDNWITELAVNAPGADHGLWSTRAKNTVTNTFYNSAAGAETWRCKECHGWDYKGVSGVYGDTANLHYTGFKGLFPLPSNASAISLFCAIRDSEGISAEHRFSSTNTGGALTDLQILNITRFLIEGMKDPSLVIPDSGVFPNDSQTNDAGALIFTGNLGCSNNSCHGVNGNLNADGQSLGTLALENPWEMLHSVRFGHPGATLMPSFDGSLNNSQLANLISYAQNVLPKSNNSANSCHTEFANANLDIVLLGVNAEDGGQFYDKWWLGNVTNEPTGNHPLWATQNTNGAQGAETWRCVECHGWDYKGDLGDFRVGSPHYTGFPGILAAANKSAADVYCAIRDGEGINSLHKFNAANTNNVVNQDVLLRLTKFITAKNDNAMKDPALFIGNNGIALGDSQLGAAVYSGRATCIDCHGADGKNNVPAGTSLGDVAIDNPWEALHLIRFGNAGKVMPNYSRDNTGYDLSDAEIKNVLAFIQTIPRANQNGSNTSLETCVQDMGSYVTANIGNVAASQGGALYDNWWAALGYAASQAPTTDHPLWSAANGANTSSGSQTWRCTECHGWDYKGKDGNYGLGSPHYTGFAGVFNSRNKAPIDIFCAIHQGTVQYPQHQFNAQTTLLSDLAVLQLTRFITDNTLGVIDMNAYIDASGNPINGDSVSGQTKFSECAVCHGSDGTLNANGSTLGTIANENPWEMLHTMRYGHPGSNPAMPAYVESTVVSSNDMVNIIAFAKTLPTSGGIIDPPLPDAKTQIIAGGQLYDHWMNTKGVATPANDNPLWILQSTNNRTGADTWRCAECHGWDYKGRDGQFGPGSDHYTGFKGVYAIGTDTAKSETDVFNVIKFGLTGSIHRYGDYLSDADIQALAKFIKQGLINTDLYISPSNGNALNANISNGKTQFESSDLTNDAGCAACHGADGLAINFGTTNLPESLGTLGRQNPWEVLHKARFGQPATIMPSAEAKGLSLSILIDVMGYIQTLPNFPPP